MTGMYGYHVTYPDPALVLWTVVGGWLGLLGLIRLAVFLLKGYPLYRIARRRGLHHAWLSWLPVGQDWIRGSVSDQYQYLTRGKNNSRRIILTALGAAAKVLELIGLGLGIHYAAAALLRMGHMPHAATIYALRWAVGGMVLGFLSICVWAARAVFHHMCMYDLYRSTDPKNDTAMTVLGIVIPVLELFFVFYVREKDDGMPPRRDQAGTSGPRPGQPEPEEPVDADYRSPDYEFHDPEQL